MKTKLLILIALYFFTSANFAQQPNLSVSVERWQGLWQGVVGNDTTTLYIIQTFSPAEKDLKGKNFIGMYGWHSIKQKNIVIESSIENASDKWNDKVTITAGYKHLSDSMYLVISDLTRNILLGAYMILISENEALLKTWMKETWRSDNKTYPSGQSFPKEIRLVRQANIIKCL